MVRALPRSRPARLRLRSSVRLERITHNDEVPCSIQGVATTRFLPEIQADSCGFMWIHVDFGEFRRIHARFKRISADSCQIQAVCGPPQARAAAQMLMVSAPAARKARAAAFTVLPLVTTSSTTAICRYWLAAA